MDRKITKSAPEAALPEDGFLKDTAVVIGGAAGKISAIAKSVFTHPTEAKPAPTAKGKAGKLPAKNKSRLPRKQKKVLAKR